MTRLYRCNDIKNNNHNMEEVYIIIATKPNGIIKIIHKEGKLLYWYSFGEANETKKMLSELFPKFKYHIRTFKLEKKFIDEMM